MRNLTLIMLLLIVSCESAIRKILKQSIKEICDKYSLYAKNKDLWAFITLR